MYDVNVMMVIFDFKRIKQVKLHFLNMQEKLLYKFVLCLFDTFLLFYTNINISET